MKKQLLIAAVAATMTSVAIADISITGNTKVNYTNTEVDATHATLAQSSNAFNHDLDLTVVGKNGDTSVSMTVATTASGAAGAAGGLAVENTVLATKIGDVAIKTGTWMTGDDMLTATSRANGKFEASTDFSGVKVTYSDAENSNATIKLAGSVADVALSYERGTITDTYTADATVAGFGISYKMRASDTAASDRSSLMITKEVNGVSLTYAQADADASATLTGDSWLGDFEGNTVGVMDANAGDDISGFGASMALAGNTVAVKRVSVDSATTNEGADITTVSVTRALANGSTFEMTYTDDDADLLAEDMTTLDLELAVKF